ncbi:MAG: ribosome biogenesis/translation initiation ATPase RLI [Candidatus Aenigmarchaeota archaeon]|nr:ribosome biogenesis/translation initiation ATPase RLI [Candidatus Aenigmarchaeota archaeon]
MTRIAVIDYDKCNPQGCGGFLCERLCPINRQDVLCIKTVERNEGTTKRLVPQIEEELCIGCGICIAKCPFRAISIVNTPEQLKEKPIHRYGENAFALFRLPVPTKGVVGLLGPNGCGKSTALQVLSGQIKPNLGLFHESGEDIWKELLHMHRGSELHEYLKNLADKKLKTVYKPQQVNVIPNLVHGKVDEFMHQVPKTLIHDLELENCMDRNLTELSGGELQRVAIAVAISKEADIYYIDEPSSYLDVKQRFNVAKVLRNLAEHKLVMVVEHDLATLDFLADTIHVFYGAPGVYGIVSKPYGVNTGINAFLDGYIKEDNVRIREKTTLDWSGTPKKFAEGTLVSFTALEKKFRSFSLHVDAGEIRKGEVLGVFGSNALGKTTFAKILAGELKTEGDISKKVRISYKPQYIQADSEETVDAIIATGDHTDDADILKRQLHIDALKEKKLNHLSGGELQRVSVYLALSRPADIYLLDEPSAYLDVDQRLAVAKVIKSRTAIVIDHDLLFLHFIADRAMVFRGEPGKHGTASIMDVQHGFNTFLKDVGITFRKDPDTKRPRANKLDSVKDREQKEAGKYFAL